ncbi:hypothetical protein ACNOYE_35815 [Nannocystaceae bacterium ST9]
MLNAACIGETANIDDRAESTDETDTEPKQQQPARGISITEIEINQGTRVAIGEGGEWLAEDERSLGLIASRDALLRVHYTVEPGWVARDIEARLQLEFLDGTSQTISMVATVEGDSRPDPLDGGFWFKLGAAQTLAETAYRVELWETQDELGLDLPERDWANPAAGPMPIGFEAIPLEIKVVFVPIHYLPLATTAPSDDAALAPLIDALYEQNPTNLVLFDVREPIDVDSINDLGELLPAISELKVADEAAANVYYHALIDLGGPSLAGRQGIGNIVGPDPGEGASRVAASVYWLGNPLLAAETFNHEIGHNQGLSHVMCPNSEADGLEPDYPHVNGWIGNWGAAVIREQVFAPDEAFDYMSYCGPSWVSDWTWTKTRERIATLTAWDYQDADERAGQGWLLLGAVQADGRTRWWTAPGSIDPERTSADERVVFTSDEGERIERWARVDALAEGSTRWIQVELPLALDRVATIEHVHADELVEVPRASVREVEVRPWTPSLRAR